MTVAVAVAVTVAVTVAVVKHDAFRRKGLAGCAHPAVLLALQKDTT